MHKKSTLYYIKRFFYNVFARGIHFKLLSLFIAFGLWFAVTSSEKADAVKKIPLDFVTATGLVVSADSPSFVDIKVSGPRIFVREVLERKEFIKIDLRDKKEGQVFYKFYTGMMDLPIGVKAEEFYPSGITVKIEKLKTKKVKVLPGLVGQPVNGYKMVGATVEPSSIEVSGSEGVLSKTEEVYTQVIDVSKFKEPKRIDVTLDKSYSRFFKSTSVEKFTTYIDIQPIMMKKRFNGLKIDVVGQEKYSLQTQRVDVVIQGTRDAIEKLPSSYIRAYIDISFNAPGKHSEEVKVKLPQGVELSVVQPKKVDVVVHRGE